VLVRITRILKGFCEDKWNIEVVVRGQLGYSNDFVRITGILK
jgi:hypothetical protein